MYRLLIILLLFTTSLQAQVVLDNEEGNKILQIVTDYKVMQLELNELNRNNRLLNETIAIQDSAIYSLQTTLSSTKNAWLVCRENQETTEHLWQLEKDSVKKYKRQRNMSVGACILVMILILL